jgi:hypothetical protein
MEESEIGEVAVDNQAEFAHEKAREHKHQVPWLRWLALSSASLAVVAAVASLMSGHSANEALLKQAKATDQSAYFQAKGNKATTRSAEAEILAELHVDPARVATLRREVKKICPRTGRNSCRGRGAGTRIEGRHEPTRVVRQHGHPVAGVSIGRSAIGALVESRKIWLASMVAGAIATAVFVARWVMG